MGQPEWWMICPKCGRAVRLADVGGHRVAKSKGKRALGKCSQCGRWVMAKVEELTDPPPGAVDLDR